MDRRLYLRHFFELLTGTAAAQFITLASYPLLGRLYTPEDFGVLAIFTTASVILGAIACVRYDIAIPIARHSARFAVYWLCVMLSLVVGAVAAFGAIGYDYWVGTGVSFAMTLLLGLSVFLTGFCTASTLLLLRHDRYRAASNSIVVRTGGAAAVQILLAFVWGGGTGLVAGYCSGLLLQALILVMVMRRTTIWRRPRIVHIAAVSRRFAHQAAVDVPSILLAVVSTNILNAFLLVLYDARTVGMYSLANRMVFVPFQTFNDALSRVFFQKAARAKERSGSFWLEMKLNLVISGALSVFVLFAIVLFARPFIPIFLGDMWRPSADILIVLAPMLAMSSLVNSVGTAVFILRRPQWRLAHNIAMVAAHGLVFAAAWAFDFELHLYLILISTILSFELAIYLALLTIAARRQSTAATKAI